jgi:NADP-dependent 3-hydroxy acid dehydrogenase YdfG
MSEREIGSCIRASTLVGLSPMADWAEESVAPARTAPELNAVITGASSIIGGAIAAAIASPSAALCLVGRNAERLEAIARGLRATARSVLVVKSDLTEEFAIEELTERLGQEFRALDVLVHCSGTFTTGRIETTPVKQLDDLYRTNVRLPYELTQALLPRLKLGPGQIVFINSSQGLEAKANTGPYAATQHALKALADSLRQEINADGIRVLSLYLGRTATARMEALYQAEGRKYEPEFLLQAEDIAQVVVASLRLPRTAEITDVKIRPLRKSY